MILFLLDTNIVSELSRPRPNAGFARWMASADQQAISVITVEELRYGLSKVPNQRIEQFMEHYLSTTPVFDVTADIARRAGVMRGSFTRKGITRDQSDMLIAATAQAHNLTLVTRNTRDFEGCGIGLLNPFTD
jgi:predicted nucleic acid-binding protein